MTNSVTRFNVLRVIFKDAMMRLALSYDRTLMSIKLPISNVRLARFEQSPLAYQVLKEGGNRSLNPVSPSIILWNWNTIFLRIQNSSLLL